MVQPTLAVGALFFVLEARSKGAPGAAIAVVDDISGAASAQQDEDLAIAGASALK